MLQQTQVSRVRARGTTPSSPAFPPSRRAPRHRRRRRRRVDGSRLQPPGGATCTPRRGCRRPSTAGPSRRVDASSPALPGVGAYTARAVLAFAFERDVAVVDTNVARVLARSAGRRLTRAETQRAADAAVPAGQAWAWNQAMLDVGAVCCRPRNPRCEACPLQPACRWSAAGCGDPDPATGSAGVSGRAVEVRRLRSSGSGSARGRAAPRAGARRSGAVMGWPGQPDRAGRVAATLVADGLATLAGTAYAHALRPATVPWASPVHVAA